MKKLAGLIAAIIICLFAILYPGPEKIIAHHGVCNHIDFIVNDYHMCAGAGGYCCGHIVVYPD